MSVANYTEMCLFTTSFVTDDGKPCGGVAGPRFVEVRYALEHVFNKPDENLREVGRVLRVPLEPDTGVLEECRVDMHHSPVVGWDMGGRWGGGLVRGWVVSCPFSRNACGVLVVDLPCHLLTLDWVADMSCR